MTAIPAAQDNLQVLLAADATVGPVLAAGIGKPVPQPKPVQVWIAGTVPDRKVADLTTGAGTRATEETFTIHVLILVERPDTVDMKTVRDQGISYLNAVEALIPANRTLNGAVTDASIVGDPDWHEFLAQTGRGFAAAVGIACFKLT